MGPLVERDASGALDIIPPESEIGVLARQPEEEAAGRAWPGVTEDHFPTAEHARKNPCADREVTL